MRVSRWFALTALAAVLAAGCGKADTARTPSPPASASSAVAAVSPRPAVGTPGASVPASPRDSASPAPTRDTYINVGDGWQGREIYLICVEDRSGEFGDAGLRTLLGPALKARAQAVSADRPVDVRAGCPYDYPDAAMLSTPGLADSVISRSDPNRFFYQVYVDSRARQGDSTALEYWFRGTRGESAVPITYRLTLSPVMVRDQAALVAFFDAWVNEDPTIPFSARPK
ncbi:MAG: hypothetical protein HYX53_06790 [Chloroflexi bacterium]|nr:hypothetical protein [Chloroflexota bacterium]